MPWSAPVSAVEETSQIDGEAGLANINAVASGGFAPTGDVGTRWVLVRIISECRLSSPT
jgi:hypothetical protein